MRVLNVYTDVGTVRTKALGWMELGKPRSYPLILSRLSQTYLKTLRKR